MSRSWYGLLRSEMFTVQSEAHEFSSAKISFKVYRQKLVQWKNNQDLKTSVYLNPLQQIIRMISLLHVKLSIFKVLFFKI